MGFEELTKPVPDEGGRGLPSPWFGLREVLLYLLVLFAWLGLSMVFLVSGSNLAWFVMFVPLYAGPPALILFMVRLVVRLWSTFPLLRGATTGGRVVKRNGLWLGMWRGVSVTFRRGPRELRIRHDERWRDGGGYLTDLVLDTSGLWPPGLTLEVATKGFDASDESALDQLGLVAVPPDEVGAPAGTVILAPDGATARRLLDPTLLGLLTKLDGLATRPGVCLTVTDDTATVRLVTWLPDLASAERFLELGEGLFDTLLQAVGAHPLLIEGDDALPRLHP